MSTALTTPAPTEAEFELPNASGSIMLTGGAAFGHIQRVAKMFAGSSLIPEQFKNNVANCTIALEMAHRMGANPMAVMQNLYIVHGRPGWSAQFIIACLNQCGKFSPLRFRIIGDGDDKTCTAWAKENDSGETLEGPPVSIAMAKKEGWYGKNGSKWQTMPDLMLRYRAATFFGRLYAPDLLMGMQTAEELQDVREASGNVVQTQPKLFPQVEALPVAEVDDPTPLMAFDSKLDEFGITQGTALAALKKLRLCDVEKLYDVPPSIAASVLADWETFTQACEEVLK